MYKLSYFIRFKSVLLLIFQDENVVVFPDIKPAAPHHYLIVSKEHILDAKTLGPEHKSLGKISWKAMVSFDLTQKTVGCWPTVRCILSPILKISLLSNELRLRISFTLLYTL